VPPIRSTPHRRHRAAAALAALLPDLRARAVAGLGPVEGEAFAARLELVHVDLFEALDVVYGGRVDAEGLLGELADRCLAAAVDRPADLRLLDRRREVDPAWFQRARVCDYVAYADRFAGDLRGVAGRLDYLAELGVTYLHLMPLLRPVPGRTTAATRSPTTTRSTPASAPWTTSRRSPLPCASGA
jgi:amylosucrase